MEKFKRLIIVLLLGAVVPQAYCQEDSSDVDRGTTEKYSIVFGEDNWHLFKQNASYSGERLFEEAAAEFSLSEGDSMMLVSTVADEMGYRHFRYQQVHRGIPVENAVYCVHERDGRVVSANGQIVRNLNALNRPSIATEYFMEMVRSQVPALGNVDENLEVGLVYAQRNSMLGFGADNYLLTYMLTVGDSVWYYDAETGVRVKSYSTVIGTDNCHSGTANTMYNGWQEITTKERNNKYRLVDLCRGETITAKYMYTSGFMHNYSSDDNVWDSDDTIEKCTVSAYWAAEISYDYFFNTFNRNSYDNNGSAINIITKDYVAKGAEWRSGERRIYCGIGYPNNNNPTFYPFVSLDVVGHELTHAIVTCTAGLGTSGEAGSLNESFADIFGTMIEFYVLSDGGDYIVGKEVTTDHTGLRNMSDPNQKDQPDTYQGICGIRVMTNLLKFIQTVVFRTIGSICWQKEGKA